MLYKLLATSALVASAFGQLPSSSENLVSVLSVLQTALPSSLIVEAITNSAAVSSEIASEFAAGQTPTWFTALPTDIQTYLVPLATNGASLSAIAGNITSANATAVGTISHNSTAVMASQSAIASQNSAQNSSVVSMASTASSKAASSGASATAGSAPASASSAAGANPTGVVGLGLMGAVGLLGVLAL